MSQVVMQLKLRSWEGSRDRVRWATGTAFLGSGSRRASGSGLAEVLPLPSEGVEAWGKALLSLNGFFAIVAFDGKHVVAAVDRVRSIPLFYGVKDGVLFLSDEAESVRRQVGDSVMDPLAREEFQLTGYVTGDETLYPSVKQLQAGEMLKGTVESGAVRVKRHRYYRFVHNEPEHYDEPRLRQELARVVEGAIKRLISYADGRQIVIPLSGGFDSRLIAIMLRRAGYSDLLAFTYGAANSREVEYSRRVAEALRIRWHFVEYTREKWQRAWASEERLAYQRFASHHVSLPHMQDWLAVWEMKSLGILPTDCIFVPGHGGFVAGGHIPETVGLKGPKESVALCREVLRAHYNLAPMRRISPRPEEVWCQRIWDRAEVDSIKDSVQLADAFEKWEWQERQAKFIVNAVRVYEFWGFGWWLPLWDNEFLDFWANVPLALREGKRWYGQFVQGLGMEMGISQGNSSRPLGHATRDNRVRRALKAMMRRILPSRVYRRLKTAFEIARSDLLVRNTALDSLAYRSLLLQGYEHNGIMAWTYLNEIGADSARFSMTSESTRTV